MGARSTSLFKVIGLCVGGALLIAVCAAAVLVDKKKLFGKDEENAADDQAPRTASLDPRDRNTIVVDKEAVAALGIQTATADNKKHNPQWHEKEGPPPRTLVLNGSLGYNTDRFTGVNSLFTGQITRIGTRKSALQIEGPPPPLDYGDFVEKGDLLAVLSSKDLGQMKSQLVAAASQLRLDRERWQALEALFLRGAIPEQSVRDARQKVEADIVAEKVARNTLSSWQIKKDEIEAIAQEADNILVRYKQKQLVDAAVQYEQDQKAGKKLDSAEVSVRVAWKMLHGADVKEVLLKAMLEEAATLEEKLKQKGKEEPEDEKWASVEIRAPFSGYILERNIAKGKIINDVTFDLFKIADLSRLRVWANIHEEDLALVPDPKSGKPVPWTAHLRDDPKGQKIDGFLLGFVVDPNDHTARVTGYVNNPEEKLRAGQFVTVTIPLDQADNQVDVPATALIVDGRENYVFVQPKPGEKAYALRKVKVLRRLPDWVTVQEMDKSGTEGLRPGERVVTVGVLELKAQLDDLQSAKK